MLSFVVERTHHVHILQMGEDFQRRVDFRDILRRNEKVRMDYENLNLQLASEHSKHREVYTDLKGAFIIDILSRFIS